MKPILKYIFFPVILLPALSAFAQTTPTVFSLESYTPKITVQDGANCFAYASVYVTLSTQYAFQNHLKADSSHAFSFGYVDGIIAHLGPDAVKRLAWQAYGGNINDYGNLDNSLYILQTYGAYFFYRFPYSNRPIGVIFECFIRYLTLMDYNCVSRSFSGLYHIEVIVVPLRDIRASLKLVLAEVVPFFKERNPLFQQVDFIPVGGVYPLFAHRAMFSQ